MFGEIETRITPVTLKYLKQLAEYVNNDNCSSYLKSFVIVTNEKLNSKIYDNCNLIDTLKLKRSLYEY